jgi:Carbohydrate binding domain (family 11)/PEP-CTERM motif
VHHAGNRVLQMDVATGSFAGVVHVFENAAADALAPQDWSAFDALTFWMYGSNSGVDLYVDLLDNRGGPSTYPFELWTSSFKDDFSGWKNMSIGFAGLTRKEIGNGAPNDGLGLTAVHGWALGTLATGGPRTYYVDDLRIASSVPEPATLASLCAGLIVVAGAARRRRA